MKAITVNEQFAAAHHAFDTGVQSHQLMCRIFDKFSELGTAKHNCLGCNFDDLTEQISTFLQLAGAPTTRFGLHHAYSLYVQLLNFCWERMTDVFEIIGVPDGYRVRHFGPFIRARRWANFFKHPKTFGWVVHHPRYTIEGTPEHQQLVKDPPSVRVVDDEFLKKYYSADCKANAGKLRGEFTGFENRTVVVIPDVAALTTEICTCLGHFVRMITQNPIYVEMLNDTSTIENFFAAAPCGPDGVPAKDKI